MTLNGPASHSYFSQRLKLHYADWGNEGKPPLILLHGGRDHCRNWDWTAQALRDDWHIICPDVRGHGQCVPRSRTRAALPRSSATKIFVAFEFEHYGVQRGSH